MKDSWVATIAEDDEGNLLLTFTDEQMLELGWFVGDEIDYVNVTDTSVTLINLTKNKRDLVKEE